LRFAVSRTLPVVTESARDLSRIISVGRRLAGPGFAALVVSMPAIADANLSFGGLSRLASWLAIDPATTNEFVAIAFQYLNVFFLFALNAYLLLIPLLKPRRDALRRLFEAVGLVDTALSVASLRAGRAGLARPEIEEGGALTVEDLVHPLV